MTQFLYFVENKPKTREEIADLHLDHAFDTVPTPRSIRQGPAGLNGWLLMPQGGSPDEYRVDLEKQTWRQVSALIDPERRWWLGYWTESPPRPANLERGEMLPGERLRLADGWDWLIPRAKQYREEDGRINWSPTVPRRVDLTDDGQFVYGDVLPRYQRLFQGALEYEDARQRAAGEAVEGESLEFTFAGLSQIAADAIAINYRVSLAELTMLGTWSDELPGKVMRIVVNERDFALLVKKKLDDLDSGLFSAGPEPTTEESTPDTSPTSQISEPGPQASTEDESSARKPKRKLVKNGRIVG